MLENELKKWSSEWNVSYVIILEDLINDGLTRHQRNDDRSVFVKCGSLILVNDTVYII